MSTFYRILIVQNMMHIVTYGPYTKYEETLDILYNNVKDFLKADGYSVFEYNFIIEEVIPLEETWNQLRIVLEGEQLDTGS